MQQLCERFLIELEALPDDIPVPVRLRRLLKVALRGFRFRCRSIGPVPAKDSKSHPDDANVPTVPVK